MAENDSLELSAQLSGTPPDPKVNFELVSGGGNVVSSGPTSATYFSSSANASVVIRATANYLSALSTLITITIDPSVTPFAVAPSATSSNAYVIAPGDSQTFTAFHPSLSSGSATAVGLTGVTFVPWPLVSAFSVNPTFQPAANITRLYAHENATNQWASTAVQVGTTIEPSVTITPDVTTIAPNGVVQLTANVSTGGGVTWSANISGLGGSITQSGTYTAPSTPGIYVVGAVAQGSPERYALATIIVQ
jgi:hypothetical protein